MNLPFRDMGWAATDLLLTGGAARKGKARTMRLRCELVERDSVATPRERP
jgi:DNA-binding LacI/PurR family transcriptional regulator